MRGSILSRAIPVAVMCGALLAVPLAMGASAAQSAACAKVTTVAKAGKVTATFASCTPTALKAGATATIKQPKSGPTSGQTIATITWKGSKGTTTASLKYAAAKTPGKCKPGTLRILLTGKVIKGTGAAGKIIKAGQPVTASTCVNTKTAASSLEPGTKFKL